MESRRARNGITKHLTLAGLGLGLLFWILESVVQVVVFREGNLLLQIFSPEPHEIWMRLSVMAMLMAFGAYAQFVSTWRRDVEGALAQSEERYGVLLQESRDAIFINTIDGVLIDVNQAALDLLGYTNRAEMMRLNTQDFYANPEDRVEFQNKIEASGFVRNYPLRLRRVDGKLLDCQTTASVWRTEDGAILGYFGIVRDMTEHLRAVEDLRSERNFVAAILDTVGALIVVLDHEGRIVRFNQTCERVTGYTFDEVRGKCVWDLFLISEEREPVKGVFESLSAGDFRNEYENYWLTKSGDRRLIVWSNTAITVPDGSVRYIISTGIDITERRQAEEILRRRSAELGLLYEASQEFGRAIDVDQIHNSLHDFVSRIMDCESLMVVSLNSDEKLNLEFAWVRGRRIDVSEFSSRPLRPEGKDVQSIVIQTGRPLILTDYRAQQKEGTAFYDELLEDPDAIRSSLVIPLKLGKEVISVIQVHSSRLNAYTEDDLKILEAISQHVVAALTNARLYKRAQEEVAERNRAEAALRESEQQNRTTINSIGLAIHVVDENLRFVLMNDSLKQWIVEIDLALPDDIVGRDLFEVFPFLSEKVHGEYRQVLKTDEVLVTEERTTLNGREFITETRKIPVLEGDKTVQIVTVIRDITSRRLAEEALRIQRDLAVAFSSTRDLTKALDRLLEMAIQIGGVDCGGVYLVNEHTQALDLVVHRGLSSEFVERITHYDVDSPQARLVIAGDFIHRPYSIVLGEWGEEQGEVHRREGLRSLIAAPVWYEEKVVAVLNLASHTNDEIPESSRNIIETIAAQVGGTIARVKAEEAQQHLNRQLAALLEIAAGSETAIALGDLASRLAHVLADRMAYTSVSIWVLEGERLMLLGKGGREEALPSEVPELTLEKDVIDQILFAGEGGESNDRQDFVKLIRRTGGRSEIVCALWGATDLLGILHVESDNPAVETDVDIVRAAARLTATALIGSQLFAAARRTADQLETLRRVSVDLTAVHEPDALLQLITERAIQLLKADGGGICLYRPEREILEWVIEADFASEIVGREINKGEGICGKVWETGQPLIVDDYQTWSGRSPQWADTSAQAMVGVPIQWANEFLGVINIHVEQGGRLFTQEDATLLSQFAMQAAVAIENARLYEEMETYSDLLEQAVRVRTGELNAAKERAETILASVGDHVMVTDLDGTILVVNPSFEKQTGYRAREIIGQRADILESGQTPKEVYDEMWETVRGDEVWVGEVINCRKDDSLYNVQLTVAPIRNQETEIIGFVSSGRDITRQRELDRLKDEFITNTSHELRTPISSLKLYHHLLGVNPGKRGVYMERLERETNRLEHIVEGLLYLSRMEHGEIPLARSSVDFNALVAHYVTDRALLAESSGLTLTCEQMSDLPLVQADEGLLGRALSALLTNAFNYTPEGGQVVVSVVAEEREGKQWVGFRVGDTGPGIPVEEQPLLFQRFFRGRVGRDSGMHGTGLGLSIVKEIVDRHGGRVEATSADVPGEGATFTVWLPT